MPIYMDVHIVPGVKARDVAEAHRKDLLHQEEYDCKCMTYWIDEKRENIFCLIEAPDKQAVEEMHNRAHGLIPNKIIEVRSGLVETFIGRIYDPAEAETLDDGLKIFSDPSFRILLVTKITDPVLLQHKISTEKADELLNRHNNINRFFLMILLCRFSNSSAFSVLILCCNKTGSVILVTRRMRKEGSLKIFNPSSKVSASAGSYIRPIKDSTSPLLTSIILFGINP